MSNALENELLEGNLKFQKKIMEGLESVSLDHKGPKYPLLILTCMDSRIDVHRIFQLNVGDAIVLRNAGNMYSRDVIRSILIAIYEFGVNEIIVLGHLDCGMAKVDINELKQKLPKSFVDYINPKIMNELTQLRDFFKLFKDEVKNVRDQVEIIKSFPEIPVGTRIYGMFYDFSTGWVFEDNIINNIYSLEDFVKSYKDNLYQKRIQLKSYLYSTNVEEQPLKSVREDSTMVEQEELQRDIESQREKSKKLKKLIDPTTIYKSIYDKTYAQVGQVMPNSNKKAMTGSKYLFNAPKVHVPKIRPPKISVNVPKKHSKNIEPEGEETE